MKTPEVPAEEAERLMALQALCVLGTPPEERFDRITRLVQRLFGVPIALVSLVDADRQWFKSRQGLDATETPRDVSFCGHAILAPDPFYVPDALADERFADNPLVTGPPHVRFYMGVPLAVPGGQRVGTLCIIDHVPRTFDAAQRAQLRDLAAWVVTELEHDVTRETARRLAASEHHLQAVLDNVADGIITIDRSGTILTVNQAAVAVFGYDPADLVGANIRMLMPEAYHAALDRYLEAYHTTGQAKVIGIGREVVGKRRDGTTFPFSLAVSKIGAGADRRFVGLIRDLTEHRQLELHRKRIADIVRTSNDAILSESVDGTITSWNPGAERLFGYTEHEALGQPIAMLFPPEHLHEETGIIERIRDGDEVSHFETVRLRKDGGRVEVSVTISPITDEHGQVIGASKIARDITERKKVEQLKSEFVSTVSHELRTPLTSIRGALGILSDRFSDALPAKAQRMLAMAERNSQRLTLLINDILDLEKTSSTWRRSSRGSWRSSLG